MLRKARNRILVIVGTGTVGRQVPKTLADFEINDIAALPPLLCYNSYLCFDSSACASECWFVSCARRSLLLENLALRQQLTVLKRRHPRPRLDLLDKLFWVAIRRFWSGWQRSLIAVTPETVVRWHKAGFRLYWKLISKVRRPVGRRQHRRWVVVSEKARSRSVPGRAWV